MAGSSAKQQGWCHKAAGWRIWNRPGELTRMLFSTIIRQHILNDTIRYLIENAGSGQADV